MVIYIHNELLQQERENKGKPHNNTFMYYVGFNKCNVLIIFSIASCFKISVLNVCWVQNDFKACFFAMTHVDYIMLLLLHISFILLPVNIKLYSFVPSLSEAISWYKMYSQYIKQYETIRTYQHKMKNRKCVKFYFQ